LSIWRTKTCVLLLFSLAIANADQESNDLLTQVRAKYAALKTYSDTGVVTIESRGPGATGPALVESHTFTTFFRAPRQFFFDFRKDPKISKERYVVWANVTDFNSWWSTTKVHDTYPKGRGANAFAMASFPTKNSIMQLSPLLFPQGNLHGPIADLKVSGGDEIEVVNGHRCHKLVGEVGLAYGTGAVTNIRPTTVWVDAESLLVRKVLEDTPRNAGGIDRVTTTFDPQADPKVDDAVFAFMPPAAN
jgi:outer membrane lipoprotein-sorting protein